MAVETADTMAMAELPGCSVAAIQPTDSVFIKRLVFNPGQIADFASVQVTISSKPGAYAEPLSYRCTGQYLETVGDLLGNQLTLPIFGLYQRHLNRVTLAFELVGGGELHL
jgi:hypothetical protein